MPPLNFDDTLGVAEAIAVSGAPKAAAAYLHFPRTLNAIFTELRGVQDERLAFSERRAVRRADLARRVDRAQFRDDRKQAEEQLAEFDASTKRRTTEFAERTAAAHARQETDGRCAETVHEFLRETLGKGRRLRDVPAPNPAVLPSGFAASIEAKRAEIADNTERRRQIEQTPARSEDLKAAMSRAVAREAEKGRPPFDPRIRGRDPSKFADQLLVKVNTVSMMVGQGGVPFLVWLLADQIEARLRALVHEADLTGAMSDAEQAAALAALDAQRLAIERGEEALIRIAEAQGMAIARRADMDPRAALMVEVIA